MRLLKLVTTGELLLAASLAGRPTRIDPDLAAMLDPAGLHVVTKAEPFSANNEQAPTHARICANCVLTNDDATRVVYLDVRLPDLDLWTSYDGKTLANRRGYLALDSGSSTPEAEDRSGSEVDE